MDNRESPPKDVPEIPSIPQFEEDNPKTEPLSPEVRLDILKAQSEEARKDADSDHARKRDTWVTIAGFTLVLVLIVVYWLTAFLMKPNDYLSHFLNLLNSVVMLILGYIFTKISQR
jgi:cation transport ATPase